MSRTYLFKIALSMFLFSILFAGGVSAQTNSCAIKMEVYRYNTEKMIDGATATAVNDETKKTYRSVLTGGQPSFKELPQGIYRVYVRKVGYMRSADDFTLDCSEDNDNFPWTIDLYKGNPKLTVKIYNVPRVPDKITAIRSDVPVRSLGETDGFGESNTTVPPTENSGGLGAGTSSVPKTVVGGVVNGKATTLIKPPYPAAARAVRASGAVNVQVTIDESGKVIYASAVSGHPLLRGAAVAAAKASTFSPTLLSGRPVKVTGIIVYNFVAP